MEAPGFLKRLARYVLRRELDVLRGALLQSQSACRNAEADAARFRSRCWMVCDWYTYVYRERMASEHRAVVEYLRHGAEGANPKQMGVHPFKRWDRWPLPEDVADLVAKERQERVAQLEARG